MKLHFTDLLHYNDWANQKVLGIISISNINNKKVISLMSHVLSAQFIWYLRLTNKATSVFPIWEIYKPSELLTMNEDSTNHWVSLLQQTDDLQKVFRYKNIKGVQYERTLQQILTHIINHGTHHRAQIVTLLKSEGIEPPILDYIYYIKD